MINLYFFQWPSDLGGADTRLKDLIQGLSHSNKYNLHAVPNDNERLSEHLNVSFLEKNNVKILTWDQLPENTNGYAIAFCNFRLFSEKWRIQKIKQIGLKMIWSNDMMWTTKDEIDCLKENLIDVYLFTSEFHKYILEQKSPEIKNNKSYILPNYFFPDKYNNFEKKESYQDKFVIGKLSRADIMKFSENFPLFYEKIPIHNSLFRVMGWNNNLQQKFKWFNFKESKWNLLPENKESILEFLSQLDLYVFNAHHRYIENQTRAMIEAQLIGVPAIAPNYGNFPNIIWHGKNGFLYNTIEEAYTYIRYLYENPNILKSFKDNSRNLSKLIWCDIDSQLNSLDEILKLALN